MLLAFPAIAAYQQRRMPIFEFLARKWEGPTPVGYEDFISKRTIFSFDQIDKFGRKTGTKENLTTYDFANYLRRVLHYGVASRIDDSSLVGQYAETFRQKDFNVNYASTYRSGEASSSLRNLNVMIRKAGRLTE
jgi:hypothetical protein